MKVHQNKIYGRFGMIDGISERIEVVFSEKALDTFAKGINLSEYDPENVYHFIDVLFRQEAPIEEGHWIISEIPGLPCTVLGRIKAFVHIGEKVQILIDDLHFSLGCDETIQEDHINHIRSVAGRT